MPGQPLLIREWTEGTVYLVQFPRAGCIPSASPFSLKLETWLRMAQIPYKNVSNEFKHYSAKKQIPFVELNGRQVADSNFVIQYLVKELHKEELMESGLTKMQEAEKTAFMHLIEQSIFWAMVYNRSRDNSWFATEQGFIGHLSGIKKFAFQKVVLGAFRKKIAGAVHSQGYGRHTPEEIEQIVCNDLDALSTLLADHQYFFGRGNAGSFDATVFGHLSQLLYTPLISDTIKQHLVNKCQNLHAFILRIKEQYWPDWDEACKNLSLDTNYKKD